LSAGTGAVTPQSTSTRLPARCWRSRAAGPPSTSGVALSAWLIVGSSLRRCARAGSPAGRRSLRGGRGSPTRSARA